MSELDEYLSLAKELAEDASKVMLEYFGSDGIGIELKKDQTRVTLADTKINDLVIAKIGKKFPGHSVMGEEGSNSKQGEYVWVCDPIGGTLPYSVGIPISTFNLALLKNGESIVAVQKNPFIDQLFWATKGGGAFKNGKQLKMTGHFLGKLPVNCEVYANERNVFSNPAAESEIWQELLANEYVPMKLISVAFSGALVASGELAASIFSVRHNWEAATVSLLVQEAGGEFTSLFGEIEKLDTKLNGFIAAPKNIHRDLLSFIKPLAEKYRER